MKRREFITLIGGAAVAWGLAFPAQTKQMRRIGVLMGLAASDPEAQSRLVAFENGLRELGWVKGRNLSIEYRWAGDGNLLRDQAAELLAMAPDLILANSTPARRASRGSRSSSTRRARRSPTCSCSRSRQWQPPSQWRRSRLPCTTPTMSIACSMRSRANQMEV